MHQYSQQQQALGGGPGPQPPMPPPHQNGIGSAGAIYVTAQQQQQQQPQHMLSGPAPGIPNSQSANSVVYASQSQLDGGRMMGAGIVPMPPQPPQPPAMPNGPPAPPNAYGQMNGGSGQAQIKAENPYGPLPPQAPPNMMPAISQSQPMPPPLNRMSSTGQSVPTVGAPAPPPPPSFGPAAPPAPPAPAFGAAAPPAPPAPPAMAAAAAPPPPPPPPMLGGKGDPQTDMMGSLAAQLQQAKLKKKVGFEFC